MIRKYTFYDLINEFIIEIPIIQRDYAQGRELSNVAYIREKFVTTLVSRLVAKQPLHLGFVYGKIEGRDKLRKTQVHKQMVETLLSTIKQYANQFDIQLETKVSTEILEEGNSLRFIPLDGQQRLTTLFLFFWYINMRQKGENQYWLANFKYNNRKSALAFFQALSNAQSITCVANELKDNLKEQIRNYTWYLNKWDYDATVSGALIMLQSIHLEFMKYPGFDFNTIVLEKLKYSFDFLDLDELRQSDELYIKMNERGKLLTDFEHFKAWLQDYTSKNYIDTQHKNFLDGFWQNLDTIWLDFFWKKIDADYSNLDDFYFNYLKTIAITYHLANYETQDIPEFLKHLWQDIRNTEVYDKEKVKYIPISKFTHKFKKEDKEEVFELFSFEALVFIHKSFEVLMTLHKDRDIQNAINDVIKRPFATHKIESVYLKKNAFTLGLWDHVMYFGILKYIGKCKHVNIDHLKNWLRIVRNIIYNTYIQNPENLYNALHSINKLTDDYFDDKLFLSQRIQDVSFDLKFFNQSQIKEETIKGLLIEDLKWKEQLEKLENHPYFYGQIEFILKLSSNEFNEFELDNIISYGGILTELFQFETEEFLLQRALLSIGDYLVQTGSNYTFCKTETDSLRSRNENWRRVFNDEKRLRLLSELIFKIHENNAIDIKDSLNSIIESNQYIIENWEYYFVNESYTLKKCKGVEIRWFDSNNVRLLQGSAITGYHLELRTIFLLKYLHKNLNGFAPFEKIEFLWDKSTNGHPGISLMNFKANDELYRLDIRYDFKKSLIYNLHFRECSSPVKPVSQKILDNLLSLGFNLHEKANELLLSVNYMSLIETIESINIVILNYND